MAAQFVAFDEAALARLCERVEAKDNGELKSFLEGDGNDQFKCDQLGLRGVPYQRLRAQFKCGECVCGVRVGSTTSVGALSCASRRRRHHPCG